MDELPPPETTDTLTAVLREALPSHYQTIAPALARLLADADRAPRRLGAHQAPLSGSKPLLSFHEGLVDGDVSISDVAGRDVINIVINVQPSVSEQAIPPPPQERSTGDWQWGALNQALLACYVAISATLMLMPWHMISNAVVLGLSVGGIVWVQLDRLHLSRQRSFNHPLVTLLLLAVLVGGVL